MGEFFHGWRRKFGVVMLVMGCTLIAGWVRSSHFRDGISVSLNNKSSETLESFAQGVRLIHYFSDDHWPHEDIEPHLSQPAEILTVAKMARSMKWHSEHFEDALSEYEESWPWRQGFFGFEVAKTGRMALYYEWKQTAYTIPYWSLAIPLTLISASLLLSKPRQTTPVKIIEPITNEGA